MDLRMACLALILPLCQPQVVATIIHMLHNHESMAHFAAELCRTLVNGSTSDDRLFVALLREIGRMRPSGNSAQAQGVKVLCTMPLQPLGLLHECSGVCCVCFLVLTPSTSVPRRTLHPSWRSAPPPCRWP